MPNHVQNILTFGGSAEAVKKVMDFIKGNNADDNGTSLIDFNVIVPMPEELRIEETTAGEEAMLYLSLKNEDEKSEQFEKLREKVEGWSEENREEYMKLGRAYAKNLDLYGARTWHDWRLMNWGTKWNAYGQHLDGNLSIWFRTANNTPGPAIARLAELFPEVTIDLLYADEDPGYNVGHVTFEDGECVDADLPEGGSDEAMRIYFATHPGNEAFFHKNEDGAWVY